MHLALLSTKLAIADHKLMELKKSIRLICHRLGIEVSFLDMEHTTVHFSREGRTGLFYRGKRERQFDLLIGPELLCKDYFLSRMDSILFQLGNHFKSTKTIIMNYPHDLRHYYDKLILLSYLASRGIPIPSIVSLRKINLLDQAVAVLGGLPIVVRMSVPKRTREIIVCESFNSLEACLKIAFSFGMSIFLQSYIPGYEREFMRMIFVDDNLSICLNVQKDDKSDNFTASEVSEPDEDSVSLVKRAMGVCGLSWASADLVRYGNKFLIDSLTVSPLAPLDLCFNGSGMSKLAQLNEIILDAIFKVARGAFNKKAFKMRMD